MELRIIIVLFAWYNNNYMMQVKAELLSQVVKFNICQGIVIGSINIFTFACAHSEVDRPRMNVIPGKACGLQTEMRYLDYLGKQIFLFENSRTSILMRIIAR